jgi:hypothetical protein
MLLQKLQPIKIRAYAIEYISAVTEPDGLVKI